MRGMSAKNEKMQLQSWFKSAEIYFWWYLWFWYVWITHKYTSITPFLSKHVNRVATWVYLFYLKMPCLAWQRGKYDNWQCSCQLVTFAAVTPGIAASPTWRSRWCRHWCKFMPCRALSRLEKDACMVGMLILSICWTLAGALNACVKSGIENQFRRQFTNRTETLGSEPIRKFACSLRLPCDVNKCCWCASGCKKL